MKGKCSSNVKTETDQVKYCKQERALTLEAADPILAKYLSIQVSEYCIFARREFKYCIFAP